MANPTDTDDLRAAAFTYVDALVAADQPYVRKHQLQEFQFDGRRFPLIDPQKGIRKPAGWSTVLSITSTQRSADAGGYDDVEYGDGTVAYQLMRETTSDAPATNRAMLHSMNRGRPILYLIEVDTSTYEPVYPVWLTGTEGNAVLVSDVSPTGEYSQTVDFRRYSRTVVKRRLHQEEFRARVLFAYEDRCCICRLGRRGLLDAAHIIDDAHELGLAEVPNGLAMCRIHHGAYDQSLIGIRPDLVIDVRKDVRDERDGPMLRFGLQEIAGQKITIPRKLKSRPDPGGLEWKYERFLKSA